MGLVVLAVLAGAAFFGSSPERTPAADRESAVEDQEPVRGLVRNPEPRAEPAPEPLRTNLDPGGRQPAPSPETGISPIPDGRSDSASRTPSGTRAGPRTRKGTAQFPRRDDHNAFDAHALEELGMDPDRVDEIFDLWANPIPGQINALSSDAERAESFRNLDADQLDAIRASLGEDGYDALLYATGRNNRLVVMEVPAGSPGWNAGLQPGDQIFDLDGQRIFDRSALNWAEHGLPQNGYVPLTILRNGELIVVQLDGGRARVKLEGARLPPFPP